MNDDYRIEWFSGTGKGGQHRNKHQNCCRVIHEPTGIKAQGTGDRSREANYRNAMAVCRSRVAAHLHKDTERFRADPNERVRTYNIATNRVTDHASGHQCRWSDLVLSEMIDARRMAKGEQS